MFRILLLIVSMVILCSCSKGKQENTDNVPPTDEAITKVNADASFKKPDISQFEKALVHADLGFSSASIGKLDVVTKPIPYLPEKESLFYEKYAGIYIGRDLYNSRAKPLTNLVPIETSWGKDYYFLTYIAIIDYSLAQGKFFRNWGDNGGYIDDTAVFTVNPDWVRISSHDSHLEYINSYIENRQEKLKNFESHPMSSDLRNQLPSIYRKIILAIEFLDQSALPDLVSSQYGLSLNRPHVHSIQKQQVGDAIDRILKANAIGDYSGVPDPPRLLSLFGLDLQRITRLKFKVYVNEYINADVEEIRFSYPDSLLLEFVFEETNEFFSLTLVKEESSWKVCLAMNGTSDL